MMNIEKDSTNIVLVEKKSLKKEVKKESLNDLIKLQKSYNEDIIEVKKHMDNLSQEINKLNTTYYQLSIEKKKEYLTILVEFILQNPKITNAAKYKKELKYELYNSISEDRVFKTLYEKLLSKKEIKENQTIEQKLGQEILENINIEVDWEWYHNFDIRDGSNNPEERKKFLEINEYLRESTKKNFEEMMDDEEGFMKDLFNTFNEFAGNSERDTAFEQHNEKKS